MIRICFQAIAILFLSLSYSAPKDDICLLANNETGINYNDICKIIYQNDEIKNAWAIAEKRESLKPILLYPLIIGGSVLAAIGFYKTIQHVGGCAVGEVFGDKCGINPGLIYYAGSGLCLAGGIVIKYGFIKSSKNKAKKITFEFINKNAS